MAMKEIVLGRFKAGLNTRDAAGELATDEIPDALNVSIDERGSPQKRLGYERRFSTAIAADKVSNVFYWATRGLLVEQIGTGMYVNNGSSFHTWSTNARVGMCEFLGNLIMVHPVDGMKMYDNTTVTTPTNAPKGSTCATWQNKIWIGGDPAQPPRLYYTDIGSANSTSVNQFNDLREKDSAIITCLTGGSGVDIQGRPGLMAFKKESAYRIYDSANGAYNTIDTAIGCGSNIGAVSAYGRTYTASTRGIYWTDGINPMQEASQKIENTFHEDQLNLSRPDLFAVGRYQDRLWFSFPASGETHNTLAFEHSPSGGWIMAHTNAMACYAAVGQAEVACGSPTTNGLIFNLNRSGADDAADIASYMQFIWTEPNAGNKVRIRRARFIGLGIFDAALFKDYEVDQSLRTLSVSLISSAAIYDDPGAIYDDPDTLYGPTKFQVQQDFWSIGTCRAFSIRVEESSSLTLPGRPILGMDQNEQGAWTLGHVSLLVVDLGFH